MVRQERACPQPAKLTNLRKLTLESTEINILGHIVVPKLEELELLFLSRSIQEASHRRAQSVQFTSHTTFCAACLKNNECARPRCWSQDDARNVS
jgi:hypothetical protein